MRKSNYPIIKKMAKRNIKKKHGQNIFLVLAIFTTTFMIATVINLCVNQMERQRLYSLKRGMDDVGVEPIIYVLAIVGVFVMIAGFFIINNVMSMSVSGDIRLYGLLKAVGTSKKQIGKMVSRQIGNLCAIGIPLGLLASVLTTRISVPLFLRMYGVGMEEYSIVYHPAAFIGAAFFTFVTAITGAYAPMRTAARLSPMEALKYSEYGYFHKIKTTKYSPIKMACRNIIREPKRTIKVFCGLFIGLTAFLTVSVILKSASIDMFMEQTAIYNEDSIYLRSSLAELENSILNEQEEVFSEKLIGDLGSLPGLKNMRLSYFQTIQMEVKDRDGDNQSLPGYIYGIDEDGILALSEQLDSPIDQEAFLRGEFVILRKLYRGSYIDSGNATFYVGDKAISYSIGGFLPEEFDDYYGKSYNWLPGVYVSEELFQEIAGNPRIYEIELNIEKDSQEQALSMAKDFCADHEGIVLFSNIETRLEAETIVSTLNIIGKSISVMLCMIGIFNFISVIITEILSRQREFALLESVGESAKQIKLELMTEGAIYAFTTFILVGTLGSMIVYGLLFEMRKQFAYMDFNIPFVSLSIMAGVIFFICIVVPEIAYRYIGKFSIVDRLKKIG